MPTPNERKALAFLTFVILLGGAVRVVRAGSVPVADPSEEAALGRQLAVAETVAAGTNAKKHGKKANVSRLRRRTVADTVAGVVSIPFQDVRPDRSTGDSSYVPRDGWVNGFPPPLPRIDVDNRQPAGKPVEGAGNATDLVDLDVATAARIEALPRIGPALAARIVANRDSLGPFGSLEALGRVKGMGPATRRLIAPHVTFSRRPPSSPERRRYY